MLKRFEIKIVFISSLLIIFLSPLFVLADNQGQKVSFFIDEDYDISGREQLSATLKEVSQNAYFYLEDEWHENLTEGEKEEINQNLAELAQEFDQTIYPELTSTYGSERKPGIDSDYRITVLFQQMK